MPTELRETSAVGMYATANMGRRAHPLKDEKGSAVVESAGGRGATKGRGEFIDLYIASLFLPLSPVYTYHLTL